MLLLMWTDCGSITQALAVFMAVQALRDSATVRRTLRKNSKSQVIPYAKYKAAVELQVKLYAYIKTMD